MFSRPLLYRSTDLLTPLIAAIKCLGFIIHVEHTPVQEKLSVQEIMARLTTPTPASLFNASDEDEAGAAVGGPGDRVKGDSHLPSSMETQ